MVLVFGILCIAIFDFTNGFQDAADMIATAIASMSMSPAIAISLITFFTFIGPFIGGLAVADTIGEFVNVSNQSVEIAQSVAIAAVLAAISFNLFAWGFGLPNSSSNSLTSGLIGAGLFALGNSKINWGIEQLMNGHISGFMKIVTGMLFSPLAGFIVGYFLIKLLLIGLKRFTVKSKIFLIISQYITVSWLALTHGINDAQKGMGVMAMLLFASKVYPTFTVPIWVIFICAFSITLGTLFGGWKIIKTVGFGIYKVRLVHSVADQIGSAVIIGSSSVFGIPTSTTQVVTTTLMGIGAGERPRHVRWTMAKTIVSGWIINIPTCIGLGAFYCYLLMKIIS